MFGLDLGRTEAAEEVVEKDDTRAILNNRHIAPNIDLARGE